MAIETFAADITAAKAFLAAGGTCGLKPSGRKDVGGILSERPAAAAGTFTTNKVKAAPVLVCQEVLAALRERGGRARGIVFNSGNANASTGEDGLRNARLMQTLFAEGPGGSSSVEPWQVFVASTGVIGVQLPMDKLAAGIESLHPTATAGQAAVEAMMTTDTVPKTAGARFSLPLAQTSGASGNPGATAVTVAGMAKGAAMIAPHMATMLAFIGTGVARGTGNAPPVGIGAEHGCLGQVGAGDGAGNLPRVVLTRGTFDPHLEELAGALTVARHGLS